MIARIKSSGQIVNLTEIELPDSVYLYLSKGSSFVPTTQPNQHDLIFDTSEFLRKLSWKTFFYDLGKEKDKTPYSEQLDMTEVSGLDGNFISDNMNKLKPKSDMWPAHTNKLLEQVIDKVKHFASNLDLKKNKSNLTWLENQGLQWCLKMKRDGVLYFGKADKGGAILIMDPSVVDKTIRNELEDTLKYTKLDTDPRKEIDSCLKKLTTRL